MKPNEELDCKVRAIIVTFLAPYNLLWDASQKHKKIKMNKAIKIKDRTSVPTKVYS